MRSDPIQAVKGKAIMPNKWVTSWILIVFILFTPLFASVRAADEAFPRYEIIEPNVSFWITIYSRYSTTQAVVHDSDHLDIVYDVIDLKPAGQPGARKLNRKRMKAASRRYARILKRLAANPSASDADCQRVAALFGSRANARIFKRARHRVRCQIGQRDRFETGLVRSGAYLERMQAILKSYGVPSDLAYLPHVESSFNTNAYSKFGAAGMWQFTRSTGRRFLTVDYVLDERRDPFAATHAAAQLLKENYEKLGSWPLAITAYNHGAAGMQRAKAAYGDYETIFTSYRGRAFKFASRNFYSEFLAARQVASGYQRYFDRLALAKPLDTTSVNLTGFAAVKDLCRYLKVSPTEIRAMNPALRPPVFSGQKYIPAGYVLNLPAQVEAKEGDFLAQIPSDLLKEKQKPSRFYTVHRGDTAGKIARMHHVKLADLMLANDLDRRATIYVRQTLRIPQAGESILIAKNTPPPAPAASSIEVAVSADADSAADIHEELPLENAALRYQPPEPSSADLPAKADTAPAAPRNASDATDSSVKPDVVSADIGFSRVVLDQRHPVGVIRVEVEETLGHYADWAGVPTSRIRRLNGLTFGRPLHLRQKIKIPLKNVSASDFEARRYEYHKQLQEDFFAAYRISELKHYRVQPGDSYWTLCRQKFDLPLWLLKLYNNSVNLATLKIHQPLVIPAVESVSQDEPVEVEDPASPDA
jgi:membrane-bound lytic murein transglycosylase D